MKLKLPMRQGRRRGFSMVEMMVGTMIGSMVLIGAASLTFFSSRTFAALTNYVELDAYSRNALDIMTKDIRQANRLDSYSATQLTFDITGGSLSYIYNPSTRTLLRTKTGEADRVLLEECDFLRFSIYQRNPIGGTYDQYSVGTPGTCKVVQLNWVCSRTIMNQAANTESVQSAKIVIRKQ